MGVKNINFFEQHVEKIVLGVAAAGAAFMAYLATQPISLPSPNEDITPAKVEDALSRELGRLKSMQDGLEKNPVSGVPSFYNDLQNTARQPLDKSQLAPVALFGPRNVPVGNAPPPPPPIDVVVKTPTPVGPMVDDKPDKVAMKDRLLRVQALQLQLNTDKPQVDATGALVPLPAGAVLKTQTVNVVAIDGYVPVGRMILEMLKEQQQKNRVAATLQQGVIYRIEVQRKEQAPGGTWSDWKDVPLPKGAALPPDILWIPDSDLAKAMQDVQAGYKQILVPDFYRDASGQAHGPEIMTRPIPEGIQKDQANLDRDIALAKANAVGGVAPAAPAASMPAVDQLKTLSVLPFAVWDENVLPDHQYRYQVRVRLVNPTYGNAGVADKGLKNEPLLPVEANAGWVVAGVVVVHADMAFFLYDYNTPMSPDAVSGAIYKQLDGRWLSGELRGIKIGSPVAGMVGTGMSQGQEVDTKFTLVDCQPAIGKSAGSYHVILRDPAGNLVTREIPDDFKKPERLELVDKVSAGKMAATSTAPAEPAVAAPVVIPTPTPTAGRATATRAATPTPTPTPTTRGRTPVPVNPGRAP